MLHTRCFNVIYMYYSYDFFHLSLHRSHFCYFFNFMCSKTYGCKECKTLITDILIQFFSPVKGSYLIKSNSINAITHQSELPYQVIFVKLYVFF